MKLIDKDWWKPIAIWIIAMFIVNLLTIGQEPTVVKHDCKLVEESSNYSQAIKDECKKITNK
jgi:hypothetical protein